MKDKLTEEGVEREAKSHLMRRVVRREGEEDIQRKVEKERRSRAEEREGKVAPIPLQTPVKERVEKGGKEKGVASRLKTMNRYMF
jgi:hypothetical protein